MEEFNANPTYINNDLGGALSKLPPGSVIVAVYNLVDDSTTPSYVVIPSETYPTTREMLAMCATPAIDAVAADRGLMFVDYLEIIDP